MIEALRRQLHLARHHAARTDFLSFLALAFQEVGGGKLVSNWHLEAMAEHLNAVARGEITRLMINLPPRYLKSICTSVAWLRSCWAKTPNPASSAPPMPMRWH